MTLKQVKEVVNYLNPLVPSYVAVFVGRIADTGMDQLPLMAKSIEMLKVNPLAELIGQAQECYLIYFKLIKLVAK